MNKKELKDQVDELELLFDIRWRADRIAIKRWQKETGEDMKWPDHADMVVWLLNKLSKIQQKVKRLERQPKLKELESQLKATVEVYTNTVEASDKLFVENRQLKTDLEEVKFLHKNMMANANALRIEKEGLEKKVEFLADQLQLSAYQAKDKLQMCAECQSIGFHKMGCSIGMSRFNNNECAECGGYYKHKSGCKSTLLTSKPCP
jgi:hypothetical protein